MGNQQPGTPNTTQSPRMSQQERSAATRQRLCEAVLDCLADTGYARASTTEIAKRAGMTRGALVRQYQTKQFLMAAGVDYMFTRIGQHSRESLPRHIAPDERIDRLFRLLQTDIFDGRLFHASLELMAAARTDETLAELLRPQVDRWMTLYAGAVRRYLGLPRRRTGDVQTLLRMTAAMMRGFAMEAPLQPDNTSRNAELFSEWQRLARPLLTPA